MNMKVTTGPYPYPVHIHTEGGILGNVTHCISLEDAKALYQELGLVIACLDREASQ